MDSPLRLGIIGYGLAGSAFHAPVIAAEPDLAVAAILVGNSARQIQASERYPTADVVAELDIFLNLNLDAAVVATPNQTHFELTDRLLDADISVVVDKPMTTDFREAKHLVEKADRRRLLPASSFGGGLSCAAESHARILLVPFFLDWSFFRRKNLVTP